MIFEMKDCGGCRTCELACGYHHTGVFNPNKSSLKIVDRNDSKPGYFIEINIIDNIDSMGCDGCLDLEKPFCVNYCHQDEDLLAMINSVLDEKGKIKEDSNIIEDLQG
jgi:Fe-S-cluster-containing dehydrogenase component